jgi:hypothetical protein
MARPWSPAREALGMTGRLQRDQAIDVGRAVDRNRRHEHAGVQLRASRSRRRSTTRIIDTMSSRVAVGMV